jgi:hypothetical protein
VSSDSFEDWYDGIKRAPGKIAEQAAPQLGSRVRWRLNSMGYEINGGFDPARPTGPDNWQRRMRLFAGSLDPGSDLGQVWGSAYPLILAVLPEHGTGYDAGPRREQLVVEGTLWGVSGGELFLEDYVITAAGAASTSTPPQQLAGPVERPAADDDAELEQARQMLEVQMVEQLMRNPAISGPGDLVIITPQRPGQTSDGHRFTWIELFNHGFFPGVRITGPQPSEISPRSVAWENALWFDNGHCWHGVELLMSAAGPYASLKWFNLGPDAESRDCTMGLFEGSRPPPKKRSLFEDHPLPDDFEL